MASPKQHGNHRDMMKLFNYGFAKYAYSFSAGEVLRRCSGWQRNGDSVEVIAEDDVGTIAEKARKENYY